MVKFSGDKEPLKEKKDATLQDVLKAFNEV